MVSEIDIWRAARLMVKRYGDGADIEAGKRAATLFEKADREGQRAWHRIIEAIDALQKVQLGETRQ